MIDGKIYQKTKWTEPREENLKTTNLFLSNCLFLQNVCCSFYHLFIRYEVDLSERKIRPLSQEKQELEHLAVRRRTGKNNERGIRMRTRREITNPGTSAAQIGILGLIEKQSHGK